MNNVVFNKEMLSRVLEKSGLSTLVDVRIDTMGIPVKVNADSGGKPNGIPERR